MSNKPNEEVIIQNVAGFISKTTSNISFKPNLRLADRNMFAHLATGKICIRIYDFKDGKGDHAVEVTARVDIETLPYQTVMQKKSRAKQAGTWQRRTPTGKRRKDSFP